MLYAFSAFNEQKRCGGVSFGVFAMDGTYLGVINFACLKIA